MLLFNTNLHLLIVLFYFFTYLLLFILFILYVYPPDIRVVDVPIPRNKGKWRDSLRKLDEGKIAFKLVCKQHFDDIFIHEVKQKIVKPSFLFVVCLDAD